MLYCLRFVSLGILLCAVLGVLSAAVFSLKPVVQVSKAQIYINDLLADESVQLLKNIDKRIPVQRLAGAGPYTIGAKRMYQLLRLHGIYQEGDSVLGASVVSWKQLEIAPEQLAAGARADIIERLQDYADADSIEISTAQNASALMVNDDHNAPHTLLFEPLQKALLGRVPYRVRVLRGQREIKRTLLIMSVTVRKSVSVARRDLARGHVVSVGDLREQEIVINNRRQADGLLDFTDIVGCVVVNAARADVPIRAHMIRRPYAVKGGQLVDMVYQHPEFQISLRGRANGSAAIGDIVMVRGVDGGHLVKGRVIAEGQVLIQ